MHNESRPTEMHSVLIVYGNVVLLVEHRDCNLQVVIAPSKLLLLPVRLLVPSLHETARDTLFRVVRGKLLKYNGLHLFQISRL